MRARTKSCVPGLRSSRWGWGAAPLLTSDVWWDVVALRTTSPSPTHSCSLCCSHEATSRLVSLVLTSGERGFLLLRWSMKVIILLDLLCISLLSFNIKLIILFYLNLQKRRYRGAVGLCAVFWGLIAAQPPGIFTFWLLFRAVSFCMTSLRAEIGAVHFDACSKTSPAEVANPVTHSQSV